MPSAFSLSGTGRTIPSASRDTEDYLRRANPFTDLYSSPYYRGGTGVQVAPTFADLLSSQDWMNRARATDLGFRLSASGLPIINEDPFAPQRITRDPEIAAATQSILDRTRGLPTTTTLTSTPRSAAVASRIGGTPTATAGLPSTVAMGAPGARRPGTPRTGGTTSTAFGRFDLDVNNARQSFEEFARQALEARPEMEAAVAGESAALGRVFDTGPEGFEARLSDIARGQTVSATQAANRAVSQALRSGNLARLSGDPYAEARIADEVGRIRERQAGVAGDLARSNLLTTTDVQGRLSGRRQALMDQYLQSLLIPVQAQQRLGAGELANLGLLSQIESGNTLYETPEQQFARTLAILSELQRMREGNVYYRQPYQPDTAGFLPISSGVPNVIPSGFNDIFSLSQVGSPMRLGQPSPILPARPLTPQALTPQQLAARATSGPAAGSPDIMARYRAVSGVDPLTDPNFSPELWEWASTAPYTFSLAAYQ